MHRARGRPRAPGPGSSFQAKGGRRHVGRVRGARRTQRSWQRSGEEKQARRGPGRGAANPGPQPHANANTQLQNNSCTKSEATVWNPSAGMMAIYNRNQLPINKRGKSTQHFSSAKYPTTQPRAVASAALWASLSVELPMGRWGRESREGCAELGRRCRTNPTTGALGGEVELPIGPMGRRCHAPCERGVRRAPCEPMRAQSRRMREISSEALARDQERSLI